MVSLLYSQINADKGEFRRLNCVSVSPKCNMQSMMTYVHLSYHSALGIVRSQGGRVMASNEMIDMCG